ncbi:MAG: hypothetical protein JKX83_03540 [Pseudomonadales bacterium]|nr:hypothetical protein [Pseudomonadales bacterium]
MLTIKNISLAAFWLVLVVAAYYAGAMFLGEPAAPSKAKRSYQPVIVNSAKNSTSATKQSAQPSTKSSSKASSDIQIIIAANLFGNVKTATKTTENKQQVDAPETRLKFELQGIFISTNAAQTRALIAQKGKPARSYKKEDQLPGNVVLADIFENKVLLRRAGRLESLSFPKKRNSKSSKKSQNMLTYHKGNSATKAVASNKRAYYKDPVKSFGSYGLVMDDASDGLRLEGGSNSKLLERAGLKKGDLIRSVNGKTLSDFKNNESLVDSVVASGELTVEIERNGQPIILSLPIP